MIVGVLKETYPGERRVALTPAAIPLLIKAGFQVIIERDAGTSANFNDGEYEAKAAKVAQRTEVFGAADILCQVRTIGANPDLGRADLAQLRRRQVVIGLADPLSRSGVFNELAATGVRCFALELLPRITRAQSMDVLSSQATIAGHRAVLLAAATLPRMTAMMMTAAGTIQAGKAFIIGAGVAGLQAIASARRLGAIVQAYDVRTAVKEQVESLGARFVQMDLQTAEGAGGYAKAMDEAFYARQREQMGKIIAESDFVITTAAVPGSKAPLLITAEMVSRMARGSVIVDLASKIGEQGGNCELTQPNQTITTADGVTILGPTNLPAEVPQTASQLYARNIGAFLQLLVKDGKLNLDMNDEIIRQTLITDNGSIVHERLR